MTEPQVRALFKEMADGGAGTSGVDTRLALHRGRKRLRWRRAGMAGAPVLAAAAAVAVAFTAAAGPVRPAAGPAATGPAAPRQFNPLVPGVAYGWLPAGQSFVEGNVATAWSLIDAGPGGAPDWSLSLYARGQCRLTGSASRLSCPGSKLHISQRAPEVAGHRAFWTGPAPGLAWQYARDGWARMTIPTDSLGDALHGKEHLAAKALKIARHARADVTTRLVFPARFSGLPSQWRVHNVTYYVPDHGLLRGDEYMLTTGSSHFHPRVGDLGVWTNAPYVMVHPAPRDGTCSPQDPGSTRETINGYRVVLKRTHIGGLPVQELCGAHADGLWFDIQVFGAHPSIGVVNLFKHHMRLLGTDPAKWTTVPVG
jgi:hypothetical protein